MNRRFVSSAVAIAALCIVFGIATQAAAQVSFKGKTVAILIPYSVGGAADIMARQMLPFIGKQIPGNPTTIIKNMAGGGGIVGENWVYISAPADGTVIGQFSTSVTDAIFKPNNDDILCQQRPGHYQGRRAGQRQAEDLSRHQLDPEPALHAATAIHEDHGKGPQAGHGLRQQR